MTDNIININRALEDQDMSDYMKDLIPDHDMLIWSGLTADGDMSLGTTAKSNMELVWMIYRLQKLAEAIVSGDVVLGAIFQDDEGNEYTEDEVDAMVKEDDDAS